MKSMGTKFIILFIYYCDKLMFMRPHVHSSHHTPLKGYYNARKGGKKRTAKLLGHLCFSPVKEKKRLSHLSSLLLDEHNRSI